MRHPDPQNIRRARSAIDPAFLGMPVLRSKELDRLLGLELLVKNETANPLRCFKGRGASAFVAEAGAAREFVCASAGNFGQAMAWAARASGTKITVFASTNAVPQKIEAMRKLGAEVVLEGEDFDSAKEVARAFAQERDAEFVEDGAHASIAEGAGTIALELTEAAKLDAVLVPLGNGALAGGVGAWIKHEMPKARMVAVSARGAPSMAESVAAERLIERPAP